MAAGPVGGQSFDASGFSQTGGGGNSGVNPWMQGGFSPSQNAAGQAGKYQYTAAGGGVNGPSQSALDQQANTAIPVNAQMARFNAILPLLSGQFSRLNNGFATAGGANGTPPPITAGPVLNPQQIQQQVNQSRAANDQSTASQIQNSNSSLAGRGFGSNSPLQMALNQGMQNQNMATNTANETNTRLNAAQQNAGQLLNSQQANANLWATGNQLGQLALNMGKDYAKGALAGAAFNWATGAPFSAHGVGMANAALGVIATVLPRLFGR